MLGNLKYVRVKLEGIADGDRLENIFHGNSQGRTRSLVESSIAIILFVAAIEFESIVTDN